VWLANAFKCLETCPRNRSGKNYFQTKVFPRNRNVTKHNLSDHTCPRIQAIELQLAIRQLFGCPSVLSSRYFNPIASNNIAVNHKTKCKKDVAFVCHEALHTQPINLNTSVKNACHYDISNQEEALLCINMQVF